MTWHFDDGWHYDESEGKVIEAEMEVELSVTFVHRPFEDLVIEGEMDVDLDLTHGVALDLLRLIPEWHHSQDILTDYVDEVELEVGSWLTSVRDIVKLTNPNVVADRDYLKNIASLIGLTIPPEDDSTEDEIRRSIAQAIDWYKLKGTYESIDVIALIHKFTTNIYDMYTNDYSTFILQEWFVGEEDENPAGLDSSYYKSPHFGIEILLNRAYSGTSGGGSGSGGSISLTSDSGLGGSTAHLWEESYLNNFSDLVEQTRPVHTVPHYILTLNPKTDELQNVIEVSGDILSRVFPDWQFSTKYFDISDPLWSFDDGTLFDESQTTFINSVNTWYLGTGEGNIYLDSWSPATPVLTGTIDTDDITIDEEKITYEFIVPKSIAQSGIRELALTTSDGTIMFGSTFPRIDIDNRVELKVKVEIFRSDLSS